LFVDDSGLLYILDALVHRDYLAVANLDGDLIARLNPYGENSGIAVKYIFFNSDEMLTIRLSDQTCHTYLNGSFTPGGCSAWRAKDGYYYTSFERDSSIIIVKKLENPTQDCDATTVDENTIEYYGPFIAYTAFLGVDDEMRLYLFVIEYDPESWKILIIDDALNQISELIIPVTVNIYSRHLDPFMRPKDGNIYEFRCLDDGLHVVRWSKE
jgi:hypothetical protein